ncbi:MAG: sugar isomerase domain-containing protein [Candidatus Dormibacteria bacterium]
MSDAHAETDLYERFFVDLAARLERLRTSQRGPIQQAAQLIVERTVDARRTFVFGSGHSNLVTMEACGRAGGLPVFNPLLISGLLPTDQPFARTALLERVSGVAAAALDTAPVTAGDLMLIISNSGRNHVPVEMAIEAKQRGLGVVAITSLEFSTDVPSRHPSGKRLFEVADVVIDNCAPVADGMTAFAGARARIGPFSTIGGAAVMHGLACEIVDRLMARGLPSPVYISGNADNADDYNRQIFSTYAHLITYL